MTETRTLEEIEQERELKLLALKEQEQRAEHKLRTGKTLYKVTFISPEEAAQLPSVRRGRPPKIKSSHT